MPRPRKAKAALGEATAPAAPDPTTAALIERYKSRDRGFERYCLECVKIGTKKDGLRPLVLNRTQLRVLSEIRAARSRGHAPRFIILKGRQFGISTLIETLFHYSCHLWPSRSALVLAHKEPASKNLFRMTRRIFLNMPEGLREKPKQKTLKEIHFANDSRIQIEAVGDVLSYTAQYVHLSELAFVENAEETLDAILQTVPNHIDSMVAIESTAHGMGGAYHDLWVKSWGNQDKIRATGVGFIPIFIPWFEHEEYASQPWFMPDDLTHEEVLLAAKYNLTLGQVAWRRWCIETNCRGDEQVFQVWYPNTPDEAFLRSGRGVFSPDGMAYYMSCVPPATPVEMLPKPCEIDWLEDKKEPVFTPAPRGRLSIYVPPKERHRYIIGVDPSEGDAGSDPTPLEVLDQMTLSQVAEWHGKAPPDQLARYAFALGMHYNTALVVNEANNHGIAFHNTLIAMNYPNLYYRTTSEESVAGKVTLKPGWIQTYKNKHLIFDTFSQFVREKVKKRMADLTHLIKSPVLVAEMSTLVYVQKENNPQVHIQAQSGKHDDTCMAFAMALFVHRGTATAPLEPLPPEVLMSAAYEVALRRERDPVGANKLSVDLTGITCDELDKVLEARFQRRQRAGSGTEAMR